VRRKVESYEQAQTWMQLLMLVNAAKHVMLMLTCAHRACNALLLPPNAAQPDAATHSHGSSCCGQPQAQQLQLAQLHHQHC
jgi:hypothetical protein